MDTDLRRAAMSICYNSYSNKHSSSRMRGRITIIQYWTIHLDRRQKPHAIGSVSADGLRVRRTLSVGYGQCMVQDRRIARALVRAAVRVVTRARAKTGMAQRPSSFTLSAVSPKRFVFALLCWLTTGSHLSNRILPTKPSARYRHGPSRFIRGACGAAWAG
jgi:hypothetical protein